MIPYVFHLFWAGSHLSYLRYLTFKTCRIKNPNATIILHHSFDFTRNVNWVREKQDFQSDMGENYLVRLAELDIDIAPSVQYQNMLPVYQADLLRWKWLLEDGGIYIDTDQIILKSFEDLLNCSFMYCSYRIPVGVIYYPIGVIGSSKGHPISENMISLTKQYLNVNDYQSIGPPLFRALMQQHIEVTNPDGVVNYPQRHFYPAPVPDNFCEQMFIGEGPDTSESYALHWFGGYSKSHEFNSKYTEAVAKTSNDTISKLLREMGAV